VFFDRINRMYRIGRLRRLTPIVDLRRLSAKNIHATKSNKIEMSINYEENLIGVAFTDKLKVIGRFQLQKLVYILY